MFYKQSGSQASSAHESCFSVALRNTSSASWIIQRPYADTG